MQRVIGMMLIVVGASAVALAQARTPEIDPKSVASGLALLGGALLVIRANRKK
jgi:hypothetical protein